jgi:hypothetical protein
MAGHRLSLVLAGVVVGVALTATGVVVFRGDGHGGGQGRPKPTVPTALSAEGRELVGLMQKSLDATYHARYQSAIADPRAQGTLMTMDVWRKGTLTRQEVAVQAQGSKSRSDTFQVPPNVVSCTQVGDSPWTCKPPTEVKPADPPEVKVKQELARGAITARDDTVAGVPARCFTFPAGGDVSETCLMSDGVVARMVTTSSRFELAAFSGAVPDEAFTAPTAGL